MRGYSAWMPVTLGVCLSLAVSAGAADGEHAGGAEKLRLTSVADAPDPFSPPVGQAAEIGMEFSARPTDAGAGNARNEKSFSIRVTVEISGPGGTVRQLTPPEFSIQFPSDLPASQYHTVNLSTTWDGKDSLGAIVPDGTYTYAVRGTLVRYDELGNGKTQEHVVGSSGALSGTILLDATSPTLTNLQPDVEFTNDNRPVFSASYSDATSGIDTGSVKVYVNTVDVTAQATVGPTGVTYEPLQPLADGNTTWKVVVRDKAGNESTDSISFVLDTVKPVISDVQPDVEFTNDSTPAFSASYSDAGSEIDVGSVKVFVNTIDVTEDATVGSTGVTYTPAPPLDDGDITWEVVVRDKAGNESSDSISFTLDTAKPVVSDLQPDVEFMNDSTPAFSASYSDAASGIDVGSVRVLVDTTDVTEDATVGPAGVAYTPVQPLADGSITWKVVVRDRAGNQSTDSISFVLDTVKPVISDLMPEPGSLLRDPRPALSASFSDDRSGVEVNEIVIVLDDTDITAPAEPSASGFSYTPGEDLPEGSHKLVVSIKDKAGNQDTESTTFEISFLPPDPSLVEPPVDRSVVTDVFTATEFLYTGDDPIQTGVAPGTIEPRRVAVLRGRVKTRDGSALGGVNITILGRPEYGQTLSRADGMFDMAVNGGGQLVVCYERGGYLAAQRHIEVPWQDYVWAPDVVMIQVDPQVTVVDLTLEEYQVARGSAVTDDDGTRQATLIVPPGTQAELVLPDGGTQPVDSLSVHLTEYTIGDTGSEAMPAELPPTSFYTYCVELTAEESVAKVDGKDVLLSQPVPFYVENFLDFAVGCVAPHGYYDDDRGKWVPDADGIVLGIVGIVDGAAEVDTDGDGVADDPAKLAALGITDGEREELAGLYGVGQSLWRVPVTHFSCGDVNWPPPPVVAQAGAETPQNPTPEGGDDDKNDKPSERCGSIVEVQNQILGESVDLVGTPFSLNYASDRVPGRKSAYTLDIPLSNSILAIVKGIELEVRIAGQLFRKSFPATSNLTYEFTWDGKDAYRRTLQGQHPATVRIGYVYEGYYGIPDPSGRSFGRQAYLPSTVPARIDVTLWQTHRVYVGTWDVKAVGLGGWALSVHHVYDMIDRVIYFGDGERRSVQGVAAIVMETVAGFTGEAQGPVDEAYAWWHPQWQPSAMAFGADGSLYISDKMNHRVQRMRRDGSITTVAGVGTRGYSGDGGPATAAQLNFPMGLAVDEGGTLYIADYMNHAVRKVDRNGTITTIAGGSGAGFEGDGGPATSAKLRRPYAVARGPGCSLYISDTGNNRIRRVAQDGYIYTVVGTGDYGFSGDGGPAVDAELNVPLGIVVDPEGDLFIADHKNHRVRRARPTGMIATVAGSGKPGHAGDGGPATAARLYRPIGLALANDGDFYVAHSYADVTFPDRRGCVRRVRSDGIILTVAGLGGSASGALGDDGAPSRSILWDRPGQVAVSPDGDLYVAEYFPDRIRRVRSKLPGAELAGDIMIPSEDGSAAIHLFSQQGKHLRTLDAVTNKVRYEFTYDAAGRLTAVTSGDGNVTAIEHDAAGNPTAIVTPFGQTTGLQVNVHGYLESISNPANEAVGLGYHDGGGLLASFTDPRNNASTFTYDDRGLLTRDEDADGGFTGLSRVWKDEGSELTVTTPTSTWVHEYDSKGREIRTVRPDGVELTFERDQDGLLPSETNPLGYVTLYEYNAIGKVVSKKGPFDPAEGVPAESVTYTYDSRSNRASVKDENGNTTSYGYQHDRLVSITTPAGTTSYAYDFMNRKVKETDPTGAYTEWHYDDRGLCTKLSGSAAGGGGCTSCGQAAGAGGQLGDYYYDTLGRVDYYVDLEGHETHYEYDLADRRIRVTDARNYETVHTYDLAGNLETVTDANLNTTTRTYSPTNRLLSVTNGAGDETIYTYDLEGRQDSVTGGAGGTRTTTYDSMGRVETVTVTATPSPDRVTSYDYDLAGNMTHMTAGGVVTTYECDPRGNPVRTVADSGGLGYETVNEYDPGGRLVRSVDPLGHETGYQYDGANRLKKVISHLGHETVFGYDGVGRRTSVTDGANRTRSMLYNKAGWVTEVSDGHTVTNYGYDEVGNRICVTVSGRAPVYYVYDDTNNLVRSEQTWNGETIVTTRFVDGVGNVLTSTDGEDKLTAYTYDGANRVETVTNPEGETTSYGYDGAGRRTGVTFANGSSRSHIYDEAGQLIETSGGPEGTLTYTYDNMGRQISVTDANGSRETDYDTLGHVVEVRNEMGQPVIYRYDAAGRRIELEDANGNVTSYDYDDDNRLVMMTYPSVPGEPPNVEEYAYDDGGLLTGKLTPNGDVIGYGYSGAGRLSGVSFGGRTVGYGRDGAGAVTSIGGPGDVTTIGYGYDGFGRMTSESDETLNKVIDYEYDKRGLRTKLTLDATLVAYTYDGAMRLKTVKKDAAPSAAYTYDPGGRRTALALPNGVATSYQYDANDRLLDLTTTGPGGVLASFAYDLDATGNREGITYADGSRSHYEFDGAYRLTKETRTAADGMLAYEISFTYDAVGNRLSMTSKNAHPYRADAATRGLWHLDVGRGGFTVPDAAFEADPDTMLLYHLEESGPPIMDSSDSQNGGTLSGDPATLAEGRFDSAVEFDGLDDSVRAPDAPSLEPGAEDFTVEAFVKLDAAAALPAAIIARWNEELDMCAYRLFIDLDGHLAAEVSADGTAATVTALAGTTVVTADEWRHVVLQRKGNVLSLWLDGEKEAEADFAGSVFDGAAEFIVGGIFDVDGNPADVFTGVIDEVRVSTVARYPDEETPDSSGNENHGGLWRGAAITPSDEGRFDRALSLDGADDRVEVPDDPTLELGASDFTLETWIKPSDLTGVRVMIAKWAEGEKSYRLYLNEGIPKFDLSLDGTGVYTVEGMAVVETDEWTHVAATRSGTAVKLIVNDTVVATGVFAEALHDGTAPVRFGACAVEGAEGFFSGLIDEVRVSDVNREVFLGTVEVNYTYNARNQLVTETSGASAKTYSYDRNGNTTGIVETVDGVDIAQETMAYDELNRMTGYSGPAGSESFAYRGAKWHRFAANGTQFLYDGDNVLADIGGTGGGTFYVTPFLDENLSMTRSAATHYYSQDGLGSVRTLTDATGAIANRHDYLPFGGPHQPGTSVAVPQRYTYTGREQNPVLPMMYYRYRHYGARVGRFGRRDPIRHYGSGLVPPHVYAGIYQGKLESMRQLIADVNRLNVNGAAIPANILLQEVHAAMKRRHPGMFHPGGPEAESNQYTYVASQPIDYIDPYGLIACPKTIRCYWEKRTFEECWKTVARMRAAAARQAGEGLVLSFATYIADFGLVICAFAPGPVGWTCRIAVVPTTYVVALDVAGRLEQGTFNRQQIREIEACCAFTKN